MKNLKAQTASLIATLEPFYGVLASFIILAEIPELRTILGGLLILSTAAYSSIKRKK